LFDILLGLAAVIIGYLVGSIPTAYIVGRLTRGVDIRKIDTGNVGTASTMRAIGIWQGFVVGIVDIGKGAAAVVVACVLLGINIPWVLGGNPWVLGAGFAAFLGHNYPIYIRFKGGQGAATMIGVFAALTIWATLAACAVIIIIMVINRRVILFRIFFSLLLGGPTLPIFIWIFDRDWVLVVYSVVFILFMIGKNWRGVKSPKNPRKLREEP